MKYSIINKVRSEPQPGLSGRCQNCGDTVIAKCGDKKIWHWAHKGKRKCDKWWENETDWHRNWKNCFPLNWQESIHHDNNGEKHIADVKTALGYVIEFQHSYLKKEEQEKRTVFYKKIVWIVDGARRNRDIDKFSEMIKKASVICVEPMVRVVCGGESSLFSDWYCAQAPVFFDFGEETLHCLLSSYVGNRRYFVEFPRRLFIALHTQSEINAENTFEDCMQKLNLFASEHRRNELYRIKHNVYCFHPNHKFTQQEEDISKRTYDHFIKLHDRFKALMVPYFGTNI